jgi:hypothetical protein
MRLAPQLKLQFSPLDSDKGTLIARLLVASARLWEVALALAKQSGSELKGMDRLGLWP